MSPDVKLFLIDNMENIDSGDWDLVFISLINYYLNAMGGNLVPDVLKAFDKAGVDYTEGRDLNRKQIQQVLARLAYNIYPDGHYSVWDASFGLEDCDLHNQRDLDNAAKLAADMDFNIYTNIKMQDPNYWALESGKSLESFIEDMRYEIGEGSIKDFKEIKF